ncbi:MAG: mono/diheme cytochrome c family protein [Rhodothermales bacterium]|jgi:mono/diheme cytochrome c family protein
MPSAHRIGGALLLFLAISAASAAQFDRDIQPILSANCYECHGPAISKPKGGLRLSDRSSAIAKAIRPGDAANSLLIQAVRHDLDEPMPPAKTGKRLTAAQIALLAEWIDAGAEYSTHWAFRPPTRGSLRSIDAYIRARLADSALSPSEAADKRTLIRRLSLDLSGLPPTLQQVQDYLADARPDASSRLIDSLLASPHYGERMAQDWLDAARYADTTGYAADQDRTMWLYRDWVINAFNSNMPFDTFTIEQLAGDMLPNASASQRVATGFHRNSMQALGNNPRKEEFRVKGIVDRLDTTGRVWLGLTLACAECHDHKYDPISQREYYQLFAIFNNIPHNGQGFEVHGPRLEVKTAAREVTIPFTERGQTEPAAVHAYTRDLSIHTRITTTDAVANIASKYDWKAGQRSYVFGIGGEGEKNGQPGHLFAWISASARSWQGVQIFGSRPINDGKPHDVAFEFVAGESIRLLVDGQVDEQAQIFGAIPGQIAISGRDLAIGCGFRNSVTPNDFFFTGEMGELRISGGGAPVTAQVMEEMPTPRPSYIHIRGDFESQGEQVQPGLPALFAAEAKNRLQFARWLVSPENLLTARVMVNRLWQQFFGTGIVRSAEDFGAQGDWPSHPALLDWLAREFIDSGWDIRHVVRLIANSATYQQQAAISSKAREHDPDNRLLSHAPRIRLPAEQIRDSMLVISGELNPVIGGPSVFPPQPAHIGQFRDRTAGRWRTSEGPERHRRALYTYAQRMYPYPSLAIFDAPSRERSCVRRSRSNTPLQALVTLNDPVFVAGAEAFAERIQAIGADEDVRLQFAFETALARPPTPAEAVRYQEFVRTSQGNPWPLLAAALLNLDESLTRP